MLWLTTKTSRYHNSGEELFNILFMVRVVCLSGESTDGGTKSIAAADEQSLSLCVTSISVSSTSSITCLPHFGPISEWIDMKCDFGLEPVSWMVDIVGVDWNGLLSCRSSTSSTSTLLSLSSLLISSSSSSELSLSSSNWIRLPPNVRLWWNGGNDCITPFSSR